MRVKKLLSPSVAHENLQSNDYEDTNMKKFFVLPFIHDVTQSATRMISKAV